VLLNIAGGGDLTLGEVTQISEIVHEAAGDEAEIIFGAVHEPAMQGEIRVTVIATGFDRALGHQVPVPVAANASQPHIGATATTARTVIPINAHRPSTSRPSSPPPRPVSNQEQNRRFAPPPPSVKGNEQIEDLDIPTFIRRQMD
jgi:cell division protein FtsZ